MSALKPREEETLRFIRSKLKAYGIPPTCEEIAGHLGSRKSKASALYILDTLEGQGFIRRVGKRARGIELVQTKDYHATNCECGACANARYLADHKLVEALQVSPPRDLLPKLSSLKPLSKHSKAYWLLGFPASPTGSAA